MPRPQIDTSIEVGTEFRRGDRRKSSQMEWLMRVEAANWSNCRRFRLQMETESSGMSENERGSRSELPQTNTFIQVMLMVTV